MTDMTLDDARQRLFLYLVDRLGKEETARQLRTNVPSLEAWLDGRTEPPTRAVLALADLVYEIQKVQMAK